MTPRMFVISLVSVLAGVISVNVFHHIHEKNLSPPSDPVATSDASINEPAENTVADAPKAVEVEVNPLIGKHVTLSGTLYFGKLPRGTTGTIVAIPGSDDWCGSQQGFSIKWDNFSTTANPIGCHWWDELQVVE